MSSSSEEDLSKFNEAADVNLFNDSLFKEDKGTTENQSKIVVKSLASLRYLDTPGENRTDLRVTPGFQKHVANHLMKILDSSLDTDSKCFKKESSPDHDTNGNCTATLSDKKPSGGIKLFGASAAFLASCNITPPPSSRRRKRGRKVACLPIDSDENSSSNEADVSNISLRDSPDLNIKRGLSDEIDLSERFAACAVSSEWLISGDATKGWEPSFKIKEPLKGEHKPHAFHKKSKKSRKMSRLHQDDNSLKFTDDSSDLKGDEELKPGKKKSALLIKKQRGKRGKKKKKKKEKQVEEHLENSNEAHSVPDTSEDLTKVIKKKKKKKRSKSPKIKLPDVNDPAELGTLLKKIKKKKRKRHNDRFESLDEHVEHKAKLLLLAQAKHKKISKGWQNNIEFLSENLANLVMTNSKED